MLEMVRNQLVPKTNDITEDYTTLRVIGYGACGKVYSCRHNRTNEIYALKVKGKFYLLFSILILIPSLSTRRLFKTRLEHDEKLICIGDLVRVVNI